MVRPIISSHAKINRSLTKIMINDVFGRKDLIHRVLTRSVDSHGQMSALTSSDTTFTGDLQYHPDIDQRWLKTGQVNVGEAVLYISPTALSPLPKVQDLIICDSVVWEVLGLLENPELGGSVTHYAYKCRRRPND